MASSDDHGMDTSPITENYWPALRQILLSQANRVRPTRIECGICCKTMDAADDHHEIEDVFFISVAAKAASEAPIGPTRCFDVRILSCGHMFGFRCLSQWWDQQGRANSTSVQNMQCPTCRSNQRHKHCLHPIFPQSYRGRVDLERIQLTIPEGGHVPKRCLYCLLNRVIESYMKGRMLALFGDKSHEYFAQIGYKYIIRIQAMVPPGQYSECLERLLPRRACFDCVYRPDGTLEKIFKPNKTPGVVFPIQFTPFDAAFAGIGRGFNNISRDPKLWQPGVPLVKIVLGLYVPLPSSRLKEMGLTTVDYDAAEEEGEEVGDEDVE